MYITLGDGKRVSIPAYIAAIKQAKANPRGEFSRSLRGGWDCYATGMQIIYQFYADMVTDHCNRGLTISNGHSTEHYLLRRIK